MILCLALANLRFHARPQHFQRFMQKIFLTPDPIWHPEPKELLAFFMLEQEMFHFMYFSFVCYGSSGVPLLAQSTLVCSLVWLVGWHTCAVAYFPLSAQELSATVSHPSSIAEHEANRLSFVSRFLKNQDLLRVDAATKVIIATWKSSTNKAYGSLFKKWLQFCSSWQLNSGLPSLSHLFSWWAQAWRSSHCLSVFGVKNLRPPMPKYPVFCKASDLLTFLQGWKVSGLKDVTRLSVQRVHTITNIDVNVHFLDSGTFLFVFTDLKVACQRPYFTISLPARSEKDALGAAELLSDYIALSPFPLMTVSYFWALLRFINLYILILLPGGSAVF